MSAVTSPRGPLPARVYWTRRFVLLVVAFALVFGLARLLGSGGGSSGSSAQVVGADASVTTSAPSTPSTSGDPTPTEVAVAPTVSSSPTSTRSAPGAGKGSAAATPLPTSSGPCEDSDIVATPTIKDRAHAGRPVVFGMNLTTRSTAACDWTVTARSLVVKVTSGTDRIWSTQECTGAVPRQDVVVRKDTPAEVDVTWNGQRSDSDCSRSTPWAEPGYYHAVAAAFGADPVDEQFRLLAPTRPTVTAKPSPDATSSSAARSATSTASPTARATATPSRKATATPSRKATHKAGASASPARKRH